LFFRFRKFSAKLTCGKLADEFEGARSVEIVSNRILSLIEAGRLQPHLTRTAEETQTTLPENWLEAASEEASFNVRSVAVATEEMTASI